MILSRHEARANENFPEEMLPHPKYHGIFTEKNTSPTNDEFTIKNDKVQEWTSQPDRVYIYDKHIIISPQTPNTEITRMKS